MKQHSRFYTVTIFLALLSLILAGVFSIALAASPGDVDTTFGSGGLAVTDIGAATGDQAFGMAVQTDDKLIVVGQSGNSFAVVRYTAAGALDATFSGDGKVTTAIGTNARAYDTAVQADGKIVVVGESDGRFAVARYTSGGALDTTFDTDGIVTTALSGGGGADRAKAVAIQSDGKIVVAGDANGLFGVVRYNSDGSLDTTFDSDGIVTTAFPGGSAAEAVVIQSDGKIVVAGHADMGSDEDFAIVRYTSSGALDTTFDGDGAAFADFGGLGANINDLAYGMALQSDGKFVLAGYTTNGADTDMALARFNSNGSLDNGFDGDGRMTITLPGGASDVAYDVAIQQTGKIVAVGSADMGVTNKNDFVVVRLNSDGALDSNFNTDGIVTTDLQSLGFGSGSQDLGYAVGIQSDSKIVAAGYTDLPDGNDNFAVVRYESQNNAPTLSDVAKTGNEDDVTTFTQADFEAGFSDQDGDSLNKVQITSLPGTGTLALNGAAVTVNQEIPAADLGNLTYTPPADWFGNTSFGWNGHDGLEYAAAAASVNITINNVNDAPSFNRGADQTVLEDAGAQTVSGWATNMSAGPANEAGQALSFLISTDNDALFAALPQVDAATGDLTFTPAANANGTANVSVQIHDDGGTANGGMDTSAAQTLIIQVTAVNDAPAITLGSNPAVNEDSGAQTFPGWATNISPGPADESGQTLSVSVTPADNTLFSAPPQINLTNGNLTFTPAPDKFGSTTVTVELQDNGGAANGGQDTTTQQFSITINPVNDPPTFNGSAAAQNWLEDSGTHATPGWASGMDDGSPEENQALSFVVTTDNDALFAVLPGVDAATGDLTYTLADDANGSATVTVRLQDDGGAANGGSDTSTPVQFAVNVTAVNDAPSFTPGGDLIIDEENAGAQTFPAWATNVSPGPADESGQTLTFNVSNDNNSLFAAQPALDAATGDLTFTTLSGVNGAATVTVSLQDDGGAANGGADTSAEITFTITQAFVNDPPTFTAGGDQVVDEDSGPQTVSGWATNISPGTGAEAGQTLDFQVSNDNTGLFSAQPALDAATGDLTYTPAADANGTAVVTVRLHDDGGTANGGSDTSAPETFTITINPVNDAPVVTAVSLTGTENQDITFTLADFAAQFSDVDGDSLARIRITSLPAHGTLRLNGAAVTLNQEIAAADIANLTFTPDADWTGSTSFGWNGSDGAVFAASGSAVSLQVQQETFFLFLPVIIGNR